MPDTSLVVGTESEPGRRTVSNDSMVSDGGDTLLLLHDGTRWRCQLLSTVGSVCILLSLHLCHFGIFPTCFQNSSRRMSISKRPWFGSRKLSVAATLFGFCTPTTPDWHYVSRLSVRSSICSFITCQTCERYILKTNESKIIGKVINRSTLGSGGQRSRSHKAGHRIVGLVDA